MATTPQTSQETLLLTAADWWTRLRDPLGAAATIEQWLDWIAQDASHLDTFERVSAFGDRLGRLDAAARRELLAEFAPPVAAVTSSRRRWLPLAAAASLAALVLGGGVLLWGRLAGEANEPEVYASAIGQNRDLVLADGSKVALGGASRISVNYAHGTRQVTLEAGEAYFQVVHDAQHPFAVQAGDMVVHDVGTAFDVRRGAGEVAVAVTAGRVHVTAPGEANARGVDAGAGQRVSWHAQSRTLQLGTSTPAQAIGWRSQRLEFVNEPLAVVIASVNRYSAKPVRAAGHDLDGLNFTGTVRTDAINGWLHALPQVFPLAVRDDAQTVTLSAKAHDE